MMKCKDHRGLKPTHTNGVRESVHPLPVRIRLVPDEGVGQVGRGLEGLLEEVALHSYHQVDLDEVQGHRGLGHSDLQQRLVARGPGAQVAKLHVGARELDFFVENLEIQCRETLPVSTLTEAPRPMWGIRLLPKADAKQQRKQKQNKNLILHHGVKGPRL